MGVYFTPRGDLSDLRFDTGIFQLVISLSYKIIKHS